MVTSNSVVNREAVLGTAEAVHQMANPEDISPVWPVESPGEHPGLLLATPAFSLF